MCWLTPYNWIVWAIVAAMALILLGRFARFPLPVVAYLVLDIIRDIVLASPAFLCDGRHYAEWWWMFKYVDYTIKLWIIIWCAKRILWDRTNFMLFYASSGTLVVALLAWSIGPPWATVENHSIAMLLLSQAANILCIFLGFCIVMLAEEWPQPATGIGLGVITWAAGVFLVGFLQLHHIKWSDRLYPLPEMLMLGLWYWVSRRTGQVLPIGAVDQ